MNGTTTIRFLALLVLALVLSVKGDGSFPLPSSTPEVLVQAVTLGLGILFAAAALLFARPDGVLRRVPALSRPVPPWGAAAACSGLAVASALIVQFSSVHYAPFGYVSGPRIVLLCLVVSVGLLFAAARAPGRPMLFLLAACLSTLLFAAFSIRHFPLHLDRSDMFLLIEAATARLRAGLDPYTTYPALGGVPLTYLPGLWGAYVPGLVLGLDPRWTHYAALVLAVLCIQRTTAPARRPAAAALLAVFIMTPYLVYRHEIYPGVFWLTLALTFCALARGRFLLAGLAFGWSLSAYPFAWILGPLLLIGVARRWGARPAVIASVSALAVAAAVVIPFLVRSPRFAECVIGWWADKSEFSGFNLGFWLLPLVGLAGLRVLQIAAIVPFYAVAAIKRPGLSSLAALGAGLLFFVFLFNSIVWVYFYATVVLLLVVSACFAEEGSGGRGKPRALRPVVLLGATLVLVAAWGCGSEEFRPEGEKSGCPVVPDSVSFGAVERWDSLAVEIPVANEGTQSLDLAASVDGPDFHLRPTVPTRVALDPGADTVLTVVFAPAREGPQVSMLRFPDSDCPGVVLTGATPHQDVEFISMFRLADAGSVVGGCNPKAIAVDGDGNLLLSMERCKYPVSRSFHTTILNCTPEGAFIQEWLDVTDGPDGLAVGAGGTVYLIDAGAFLVRTFTSDGEATGTLGLSRVSPGKFGAPADVTVDEYGTIYVADPSAGRVQILSRSGEPLDSWWLRSPSAVQADRSGSVFVSAMTTGWSAVPYMPVLYRRKIDDQGRQSAWQSISCRYQAVTAAVGGCFYVLVRPFLPTGDPNRGIFKYTLDGSQQAYWPLGRSLNDLVADPEGFVYVVGADSLFQFTTDGDSVNAWPFGGVSIAQDGGRTLYLLDEDRVTRLTPQGAVIDTWGRTGTGDGEFSGASGITVTPEGTILVAESTNGRVQELTPDGGFLSRFGNETDEPEWPVIPCDVATGPDGEIYVASRGDDLIRKFGPGGEFLVAWGGSGTGPGEFDFPRGIAVGADGVVVVWDAGNERFQVFDADGSFIRAWAPLYDRGLAQASPVTGLSGLTPSPVGIAMDAEGRIYCPDYVNNTLVVFDREGTVLGSWGGPGTEAGQFNEPRDVAVDQQGRVYVLDEGNRRVQVFRFNPRPPYTPAD